MLPDTGLRQAPGVLIKWTGKNYSPTLAFDNLPGVLIKYTCKNAPRPRAFDKLAGVLIKWTCKNAPRPWPSTSSWCADQMDRYEYSPTLAFDKLPVC